MEQRVLPPPAKIPEMVYRSSQAFEAFLFSESMGKSPFPHQTAAARAFDSQGMSPPCLGCSAGCMEHLYPHLPSNPYRACWPLEPGLDQKAEPSPAVASHNGHEMRPLCVQTL